MTVATSSPRRAKKTVSAAAVLLLSVAPLAPALVSAPAQSRPVVEKPAPRPLLSGISPRTTSTQGGTVVTLKGRRFRTVTRVLFGSTAATSLRRVDARTLTVVAPPHAAGQVRVRVVAHGRRSRARAFTYTAQVPLPTVTEVTPHSGPPGTPVTIRGHDFSGLTGVTFDGALATVVEQSPTRLQVLAPWRGAPGPARVHVTTTAGTSPPTPGVVFTYDHRGNCYRPEVTYLYPRTGPRSGGTRVFVQGLNLIDVTGVTFGGVPATDITVSQPGRLEVTTPPHPQGDTDIQVTTPCGTSLTDGDRTAFRFVPPPPTVTGVTPGEAPRSGARVTVTGTHFEEVEQVEFGDRPGTDLVVLSSTLLQVTAPPSGSGTSYVHVTTTGGTSLATPAATFTYVAPPAVYDVYDGYGPTSGGTRVRVLGRGFTGLGGVTEVSFGGVPGTAVEVVSDAELHVTSPPHSGGFVHVLVATAAGTSQPRWDNRYSYEVEVPPAGTTAVTAPLPGGVDVSSQMFDVDCPAPGECTAVGSYRPDRHRPLVETLSGGVWTPTEVPLPADASPFHHNARLTRVTCPAVDFCVAVGGYDAREISHAPLLAVRTGTSWSVSTVPMEPAYNGDDWVSFRGLDCLPDRTCVAVGTTEGGYDDFVVVYRDGSWAVAPSPLLADNAALTDVDCTSVECVAVGWVRDFPSADRPVVVHDVGSSPTVVELPSPAANGRAALLTAVSCAADDRCTAVGSMVDDDEDRVPFHATGTGESWTTARLPLPPDWSAGWSQLNDVSCPAVGQCVASGIYSQTVRDVDGSESQASLPMVTFIEPGADRSVAAPLPNGDLVRPESRLTTALCVDIDTCAALGPYDLIHHRSRGLVVDIGAGGIRRSAPVRATDPLAETSVAGLDFDTTSSAVVVGTQYGSDRARGLLVTGVAVGP